MLNDLQITKFQTIWKKRFGQELSREVALEKGLKFLRLVELIYEPMTEVELSKVRSRQNDLMKIK